MKLSKNSLWLKIYNKISSDEPENVCQLLNVVLLQGTIILATLFVLFVFPVIAFLGLAIAYVVGYHAPFNSFHGIYNIGAAEGLIYLILGGWFYFCKRITNYQINKLANPTSPKDTVLKSWYQGFKGKYCPTIEIVD